VNFQNRLEKIQDKNDSLLCVGLDPDPDKFPPSQSIFDFNKKIIDTTSPYVCAYKPQIAFYSAQGPKGLDDLKKTIDYIKETYPEIVVILDAKRGDVPNTSEMYVKELFDVYNPDSATVNPYLGFDSLEPFFKQSDKGIFVICRTSNPGASEVQDLLINNEQLYIKIAKRILKWSENYDNVMLEIGATWPGEIGVLRKIAPEMVFLIAGIGAQGGDLEKSVKNGLRSDQKGLIINSSRGIIYASNPKQAAQNLRDEINKYR